MSVRRQRWIVIKSWLVLAVAIGIIIWAVLAKQKEIIYFHIALALLVIIGFIWGSIWIASNRKKGLYPEKGQTTMEDVRRLATTGHRGLAIGAFREITGASLREATEEVDRIESESKK